jgi:probable phosphoglycerate mutase
VIQIDPDLTEWNYGSYEGRTSEEIHRERPDWDLFRDGGPDGESTADVSARADRVIVRLRAMTGNVLIFSHGHFLRVLGARWLGLDGSSGRYFYLDTAAISALGYEHGDRDPVIRLWNECRHVSE